MTVVVGKKAIAGCPLKVFCFFLQDFPGALQLSWLELAFVSHAFMEGGHIVCGRQNVYVLSFRWDAKAFAKCFDPLAKTSMLYKVEATFRDTLTN